jgi:hypothetical protein
VLVLIYTGLLCPLYLSAVDPSCFLRCGCAIDRVCTLLSIDHVYTLLSIDRVCRTNVFDGTKQMESKGGDEDGEEGSMDLKGCPTEVEAGFLTHMEAFKYLEVGSNLKNPLRPVWVVCSESHYSVVFSADASRHSHGNAARAYALSYTMLRLTTLFVSSCRAWE